MNILDDMGESKLSAEVFILFFFLSQLLSYHHEEKSQLPHLFSFLSLFSSFYFHCKSCFL